MGKVLARVRILPESVDTNLENLAERIGSELSGLATISRKTIEPIAFGLNALVLDLVIEESEGGTYKLEEKLSGVSGISQFDIIGVSRLETEL